MLNHHGLPTPVPASKIPVEPLVQSPEGSFPTPPPRMLPRMWKPSKGNGEPEPLPHLPYPGLGVVDVPANVPPHSPPQIWVVSGGHFVRHRLVRGTSEGGDNLERLPEEF